MSDLYKLLKDLNKSIAYLNKITIQSLNSIPPDYGKSIKREIVKFRTSLNKLNAQMTRFENNAVNNSVNINNKHQFLNIYKLNSIEIDDEIDDINNGENSHKKSSGDKNNRGNNENNKNNRNNARDKLGKSNITNFGANAILMVETKEELKEETFMEFNSIYNVDISPHHIKLPVVKYLKDIPDSLYWFDGDNIRKPGIYT